MAVKAPNPQNRVVAELLEIARGDWSLVEKAGCYVEGKLYVSRTLLQKLVVQQVTKQDG